MLLSLFLHLILFRFLELVLSYSVLGNSILLMPCNSQRYAFDLFDQSGHNLLNIFFPSFIFAGSRRIIQACHRPQLCLLFDTSLGEIIYESLVLINLIGKFDSLSIERFHRILYFPFHILKFFRIILIIWIHIIVFLGCEFKRLIRTSLVLSNIFNIIIRFRGMSLVRVKLLIIVSHF